jgi:UDP-glucose 4-epimerase
MTVFVTGGAGYIGSHTCLSLLKGGYDVVVADNLSNSSEKSLDRVQSLTGRSLKFYKADILDGEALKKIFKENGIDVVLHFAGLKAVGESVTAPLEYHHNNVGGAISLCRAMKEAGVKKIVFSSSATVYGVPEKMPVREDFPLAATNPYGRTKLFVEEILRDIYASDKSWSVSLLRYFNPIGADESGELGEVPRGIPNNLMPYITQVAIGKLKQLRVFGNDYPTHDGTGVRDYIHVTDLAQGHIRAVEKVKSGRGVEAYNLGTGTGYSVFDIIRAFESASGREIPYTVVGRRPGDIAIVYADPSKAQRELGWRASRGIEQMCRDSWRWQQKNPDGYDG